jgi:hypothetical protein
MSNAKEKPALRISKNRDALRLECALADIVRRAERAKSLILASEKTTDPSLVELLNTVAARMALGWPTGYADEAESVDLTLPGGGTVQG